MSNELFDFFGTISEISTLVSLLTAQGVAENVSIETGPEFHGKIPVSVNCTEYGLYDRTAGTLTKFNDNANAE